MSTNTTKDQIVFPAQSPQDAGTPAPRGKRGRVILLSVLGGAVLLTGIGIGASNSTTTTTTVASPEVTKTVEVPAAAPAPARQPRRPPLRRPPLRRPPLRRPPLRRPPLRRPPLRRPPLRRPPLRRAASWFRTPSARTIRPPRICGGQPDCT